MCMSAEKELRVFLGVAKSFVGLLLFFGEGIINFRSSSIFCIMLDDCTCLQHLQTTRFKQLRRVHNLPFVSALGYFFFPKLPPHFTNQNTLKVFVLLIIILQTNKGRQKCQICLNIYIK